MFRARQMALTRPSPKSLFLPVLLAPEVAKGWNCIQPGQPMGQLCAQIVKYHLKAWVAGDPKKNTSLLKHYEGLQKYFDKLEFALQLKLDRACSFYDCY